MQMYRLRTLCTGTEPVHRGIAEMMAEIPHGVRPVLLAKPHHHIHRLRAKRLKPHYLRSLVSFTP